MNVLVIGANGQLGTEIRKRETNYKQWHFFYTDLPELDIIKLQEVAEYIHHNAISAIINCAAYTAVDRAENDQRKAFEVNVTGAENVAQLAARSGLVLLHVSTDLVFDGTNSFAYTESDKAHPLSVYGKTKRKGEELVLNACRNAVIVRTSWLYSSQGDNFVKTIYRVGKGCDKLWIIFDQIGTPTWAGDLANAILTILADPETGKSKTGIYHYSNEGVASWYDFAFEIMDLFGIDCRIEPIQSKNDHTLAIRPSYCVLNKSKIKTDFGLSIPHWKVSLRQCVIELELEQMKG